MQAIEKFEQPVSAWFVSIERADRRSRVYGCTGPEEKAAVPTTNHANP
jgi:hypothetical protein